MAKNNSKKDASLFASILYIVIGVLLLIFHGETLNIAMTAAGIIFIVLGALELFKKNWLGAAISLIIGILIIVLGNWVLDVVLLVFGILLAIKGVLALFDVFRSSKKTILGMLFPIFTIICGLILAFAFGEFVDIIVIIAAILIILNGVFGLFAALKK